MCISFLFCKCYPDDLILSMLSRPLTVDLLRTDLLISVFGPHILFLASIESFYDLFTIKFIITLDEHFETVNQLVSRNDSNRSQNQ